METVWLVLAIWALIGGGLILYLQPRTDPDEWPIPLWMKWLFVLSLGPPAWVAIIIAKLQGEV